MTNFTRGLAGATGAQYVLNIGFTPDAGFLLAETPAEAGAADGQALTSASSTADVLQKDIRR